jgi:molybdopterin/thiamine biosynthesis adenylyltransferase
MIDPRFTRNLDLTGGDLSSHKILICGLGSVGSYTSHCLARTGFLEQTCIDMGDVDIENIGPQFYGENQVGLPKVGAHVQNMDRMINNNGVQGIHWKLGESKVADLELIGKVNIIVLAVDSMKVRKYMYDILRIAGFKGLVLDARMGISFLNIYTFTLDNASKYGATLFSDSEAIETPCTNKATAFCSFTSGALLTKEIIRWIKNGKQSNFGNLQYDIWNDDLVRTI